MRRLVERCLAVSPEAPGSLAAVARRAPLGPEGVGWAQLFEVATEHGVRGVLVDALEGVGALPPAVARRELRGRALDALLCDAHVSALAGVLQALARAGVRATSLKGPALAERLYSRPDARPSSDFDLLVAPTDLEAATRGLSPLGYAVERGAAGRYYREHHHHVHLEHARLPVVELHFRAYRGFGGALAGAPLLARAVRHEGPRCTTWVLAPEDELLYLAVHAAGHRYERLVWLYDLKLFVAAHGARLDWDLVARRAEATGLSAVLSLTCALLASRLGVPRVWSGAVAAPDRLRGALAPALMASARVVPARFAFNTLLCATPRRALGNVARLMGRKLALELGRAAERFVAR
jgi:hypothetical protein